MRGAWWITLCFVCVQSWGQTIILHLANGDRISGQLLEESTNWVVLATAFAERLSIPAGMVQRRETNALAQAVVLGSTNRPPPAPATGIVSELTPTNKPPAKPSVAQASPPKPPEPSAFSKFLSEWSGEAQVGVNLGFSTITREAFTGHLKLTHNHKFAGSEQVLRNILSYDAAYAENDNVLSDNRMDGSIKTEYDFTKRFLLYNDITAGFDEIRNIRFQYDFGPGLGYKWLNWTNLVFKTEVGGNYQEQFFYHDMHTSRYSLRLAEDLWWQILPKLRWDEKVEFFPKLDQLSEYRVRLETNLSYLLQQNLTLTLNVVDQYDTGLPPGVSRNDLQIRSLLGIKF